MRHGWRRAARAVQHVRCASSHVRPAERLAQYDWRRVQSLALGGPDSRADVVDVVRHVRSKDPRASHLAKLCREHMLRGAWEQRPEMLSMALCVRAHETSVSDAWHWMRSAYPTWIPHPDDASWAVQALLAAKERVAAWDVWQDTRSMHVMPRASAINALLSAWGTHDAATSLVLDVGIAHLDIVGLSTYVHLHTKARVFREAVHDAAQVLRERLATSHDKIAWHAMLLYTGYTRGTEAAMQLARDSRDAFQPDAYTVSTLALCYAANGIASCDDALHMLDAIHEAVRVRPTTHALSMAIQAVLAQKSLGDPQQAFEAYALYREARTAWSLESDAAVLQPLIEAHCAAFVPHIDRAWSLLQEHIYTPPRPLWARWRRTPQRPTVDLGLFYPLVMACARLHATPLALEILACMRELRLRVPPHAALTMTRQLMSACATWDEATRTYHAVHALGGWAHDTYARVLALVCRHTIQDERAPPELALQVLGDMRHAGFHPSAQTYTVLLDYYAKVHAGLAGVRATHALIQRDVQLEPDLVLIHALMNAYNYAGAPAQVLGIWDSLVVLCHNASGTLVDDITVTIVCDTCGRAGLLDVMRRVLDTVQDMDPALMTKNVYDAWVECLARCGHLVEAMHVVLDEMRPHAHTMPDAKTVHTLLKFSQNDPEHGSHVRRALQEAFPALC